MLLRPTGLLGTRGDQEGLSGRRRRSRPQPEPPAAAHRRRRVGRVARGAARGRRGFAGRLGRGSSASRARRLAAFVARRGDCCRSSTSNDYVIRVGFDTLLYMLLALGLNIVVGYAGLLDLGYVAFFGFGAYVYAMLASRPVRPSTGRRAAIVPIVVVATALLGLLARRSRRGGCSATTSRS